MLEIVTVSLMVVPMDLMLEHPMAHKFLLSLLTLVILMRVVIQLDIIVPMLNGSLPVILKPTFRSILKLTNMI